MPAAARAGWGGEDSHMQCKDNHYFVDNNIMSGIFFFFFPNGHRVLVGFCLVAYGPVSVCLAAIRKYLLPREKTERSAAGRNIHNDSLLPTRQQAGKGWRHIDRKIKFKKNRAGL